MSNWKGLGDRAMIIGLLVAVILTRLRTGTKYDTAQKVGILVVQSQNAVLALVKIDEASR